MQKTELLDNRKYILDKQVKYVIDQTAVEDYEKVRTPRRYW